jgi:hypothetical protein
MIDRWTKHLKSGVDVNPKEKGNREGYARKA